MRRAHFMASRSEKWRPTCSAVSPVRSAADVIAALTINSQGACCSKKSAQSGIIMQVSMTMRCPITQISAVLMSGVPRQHEIDIHTAQVDGSGLVKMILYLHVLPLKSGEDC